jgi:hypothetical protein
VTPTNTPRPEQIRESLVALSDARVAERALAKRIAERREAGRAFEAKVALQEPWPGACESDK